MKLFFPDLVRAIDMGAEAKAVGGGEIWRRRDPKPEDEQRRRSGTPEKRGATTVRMMRSHYGADGGGTTNRGEKIRARRRYSFKKFWTKYPDQARAWYGIELVALAGSRCGKSQAGIRAPDRR